MAPLTFIGQEKLQSASLVMRIIEAAHIANQIRTYLSVIKMYLAKAVIIFPAI